MPGAPGQAGPSGHWERRHYPRPATPRTRHVPANSPGQVSSRLTHSLRRESGALVAPRRVSWPRFASKTWAARRGSPGRAGPQEAHGAVSGETQPGGELGGGGFARSALAHQTEDMARLHVQRNVVNRAHGTVLRAKDLAHTVEPEQWLSHASRRACVGAEPRTSSDTRWCVRYSPSTAAANRRCIAPWRTCNADGSYSLMAG